MKKYLVILFVLAMAQPLLAQTNGRMQAPVPTFESQDQENSWYKEFEKAVMASSAVSAVNADARTNGQFKPNRNVLKHMATSTSTTHRWVADYYGDFTLLGVDADGQIIETKTGDTAISVVLTDFSVWAGMKVEETDSSYWSPTTVVGTNQIIKRIDPPSSEGGENADEMAKSASGDSAFVDLNASILRTLRSVDENATFTWLIQDSSFFATMNGRDYFYQKKDGVFSAIDPDAPVVHDLGNTGLFGLGRKMKVLYGKDADGNPVGVSNVNNANKRGLGFLAGHNNLAYGNGSQQRYSLLSYAVAPMWGGGGGWNNWSGGWGNNWGVDFGWSVNLGFGGCFGCVQAPINPCYTCVPNRWISGGSSVWNGYSHVGIDWVGSGVGYTVNNNYYYDDGCGGCKSATVAGVGVGGEQYVELASADLSAPPQASLSQMNIQQGAGDSKANMHPPVTQTKAPAVVTVKTSTHGTSLNEVNTANHSRLSDPVVTVSRPTHDNGTFSNERAKPEAAKPVVRGGGLQAPAGANGRGTSETFAENRQGSSGVSTKPAAKPQTAPQGRVNGGTAALNTRPSGYGTKPSVTPPKQPRANGNQGQVYSNTTPSRNGVTVSRNTVGMRPPAAPSRTHQQVRTVGDNTRAGKPVVVRQSQPDVHQMRRNPAPPRRSVTPSRPPAAAKKSR